MNTQHGQTKRSIYRPIRPLISLQNAVPYRSPSEIIIIIKQRSKYYLKLTDIIVIVRDSCCCSIHRLFACLTATVIIAVSLYIPAVRWLLCYFKFADGSYAYTSFIASRITSVVCSFPGRLCRRYPGNVSGINRRQRGMRIK